jgi:AmiR/NasT family two-component response regulator
MPEDEPRRLRVLVADERDRYLEPVTEAVRDLGHEVIAHEVEISKVGAATLEHRPDIAIVALHEDTGHALELITEIADEATCPVVALADAASRDFVAEAARRGVFAYLDSTNETELQGGIDVALQRYEEHKRLLAAFQRRAKIERAKGILMERHQVDELQAFAMLRDRARQSGRKLVDVAQAVLDGHLLLPPTADAGRASPTTRTPPSLESETPRG